MMKREDFHGEYRILTIWQPFASLVAIGAKKVETRGWGNLKYRGPILIHAAQRWNSQLASDCKRAMTVLYRAGFTPSSEEADSISKMPWRDTLGKVLCVANLTDIQPMETHPDELEREFGWFGPDRYGWCLSDVRAVAEPFKVTGRQGLFKEIL